MEKTLQLGLLENSHRFLREAAKKARLAEHQSDQWMFAASALVQSVELALKAALADIHPILIYENIDNPKRSVTIAIAISRLTNKSIGKIEFTSKDDKRLNRAIAIRNEITHSDFSLNLSQVEANFHEVFAFLAEFNRRHLETNIDEIIDPADLVAFLSNRKHHQEMLLRARTRLEDESIVAHNLRNCSYCTEDTFVQEIDGFRCYLCHQPTKTLCQCLLADALQPPAYDVEPMRSLGQDRQYHCRPLVGDLIEQPAAAAVRREADHFQFHGGGP